MLLRFACPSCGQHISATHDQIGVTAPCPNCSAAVTVPKSSTLPTPARSPLVRFACASCGQHISATHAQIGVTAPCPNCNAAVTVPKSSTLAPPAPLPAPLQTQAQTAPVQTKLQAKKRYETTVLLIDDCAAVPAKTKKLKIWTDDFIEARDYLVCQLGAFRGEQYFAGIFDHKQKRSVFKEKGRGELDYLRFCEPGSNG